ncbi:flagellar hook-associated protein FlgK [Anaerobacillus alkalidiazotrophicus]|uniref:Flagellar hook-associated protein 1 n=1 Tax=Anaerobacillus alkalidiazotrophicus TaxID=472963 RepID=A0A1S2MCR7_9BACI|nr:flagellar hook-associated protein FlgK [Anaerobacillus alkalidiazotrophicus]OIJ22364.1 flagellar hook-associated protein FlgK [Anaerobacillus alkalidiazotrophicus]
MKSTFQGLETARRALYTQQTALHVTGHNIANANTPGYSRQRVNFSQTTPFPGVGFNRPDIPGQVGTGVQAGSIQRTRESFLDMQYRGETSKFGYWETRSIALEKMEDIMNEPTEDGIANTLDRFWTALQDLSVHPEDSGARSVVRQRGMALADTFNYTADSLMAIQRDLKVQSNATTNEINSLTRQINNLNKQIAAIEPHGYLPNDLYDQRDLLVDQLSKLVNIKVEPVRSGGQALEIAEGRYTVKLIDENGRDLGVTLVDGTRLTNNDVKVEYDQNSGLVSQILVGPAGFDDNALSGVVAFNFEDFNAIGKLVADIEAHGYLAKDGSEQGVYPKMLRDLDTMVVTFVEEFNRVHHEGWNLNDVKDGAKGDPIDFFTFAGFTPTAGNPKGAATSLRVSDEIVNELDNIAASIPTSIADSNRGFAGDGSNALALANVKDAMLNFGGTTTTVQSFYQGVIGEMAVSGNEAERMMKNTDTLRLSVDQRRESISGVSLDEEMTNLIQFQHAYNAAARTITLVDEMLDTIINRMGTVGR